MYFGDGAVNDLDDWSNFLEVPDFMASFNCSQVRVEAFPQMLPDVCTPGACPKVAVDQFCCMQVVTCVEVTYHSSRQQLPACLDKSSAVCIGKPFVCARLLSSSYPAAVMPDQHVSGVQCSRVRVANHDSALRRARRRSWPPRRRSTSRLCRCATPPASSAGAAWRARPAPCATAACPARRAPRGRPRRTAWSPRCRR